MTKTEIGKWYKNRGCKTYPKRLKGKKPGEFSIRFYDGSEFEATRPPESLYWRSGRGLGHITHYRINK